MILDLSSSNVVARGIMPFDQVEPLYDRINRHGSAQGACLARRRQLRSFSRRGAKTLFRVTSFRIAQSRASSSSSGGDAMVVSR